MLSSRYPESKMKDLAKQARALWSSRDFRMMSLSIILSTFFIDQITKYFSYKIYYHKVNAFFNIVFSRNYGMTFGFFQCYGCLVHKLIFVFIFIVFLFAVSLLIRARTKHETIAYSMIVGGAIGNIMDRISYGYVVDFLQFHYMHWYYPVFNMADTFIVMGIGSLILFQLKSGSLLKNP
ncbi:MAG: signal peptidase II [Alphaproteobacteria bacterium]|nr:MAG: signal peptidase II [Alphaproteobacteria bacterium]